MKTKLSVANQIQLASVLGGFMWLLMGIFGLFDGIMFNILEIIVTVVCVAILVYIARANKELMDEMASANLHKAKAHVLDIMQILYCALAIVTMFMLKEITVTLDWSKVIPACLFITLGIREVLVGMLFRKYEAE